ncbi:MAG: PDGLE domain-containing protein [Nitrospirota bacterium]
MKLWIVVLIIGIICSFFLSPIASSHPDGLEKVAEDQAFIDRGAGEPLINSPIPDYTMPGISNERWATGIAGIVGTLIVFAVTLIIAKIMEKPER